MKYSLQQLPGEQYYRQFLNDLEIKLQESYRAFQDWRLKIGIPMTDIDALISDMSIESFGSMKNLEYSNINNEINNYAVIEMKHWRTSSQVIEKIITQPHPVKLLADAANLPFYVVKYLPAQENNGKWEFTVYNGNQQANRYLKEPQHMSERQYVNFLYSIRETKPPVSIIKNCCPEKSEKWEMRP